MPRNESKICKKFKYRIHWISTNLAAFEFGFWFESWKNQGLESTSFWKGAYHERFWEIWIRKKLLTNSFNSLSNHEQRNFDIRKFQLNLKVTKDS